MMFPEYVYEGVREQLGYGASNAEFDADIDGLGRDKVLDLYLKNVGGVRDAETFTRLVEDVWQ